MKEEAEIEGVSIQNGEILTGVRNLRLRILALESSNMKSEDEVAQEFDVPNSVLQNDVDLGVKGATEHDSHETQPSAGDDGKCSSRATGKNALSGDQDGTKEVLQNQEKKLNMQMNAKSSALLHIKELQLPKAAEKMVFDDSQPVEFYIEQLSDLVEAKKQKLKELESEWEVMDKPLLEKQRNLKKSLLELHPEAYAMFTRRKEIELETESIVADIKRREEELCKLSSDLEKQPKLTPRRTYIERINEITKNSRKQDTDIQRILKDTRELQLESNTIQERLNRTYAVVEETIFREAKKDPVARQAYRLLTNIHSSFEQIAEKILATDRCRRDFADYESKLANLSSRSSNIDSIQANLDAIRKENDLLEQRLRNV